MCRLQTVLIVRLKLNNRLTVINFALRISTFKNAAVKDLRLSVLKTSRNWIVSFLNRR